MISNTCKRLIEWQFWGDDFESHLFTYPLTFGNVTFL